MNQYAGLDADYYDHLPDGTILGKIPYDDGEKMIALLQEHMTPEKRSSVNDSSPSVARGIPKK